MVFINYAAMQLSAKIVYYGPGLCGKTTSLQYIYRRTADDSRGELVSLDTETDRTLFFDLLPMEVGVIGGFKTKIQLYTVPGQVCYNTTRQLLLRGVDGMVFAAPLPELLSESSESGRVDEIVQVHLVGEQPETLHPKLALRERALEIGVG